MLKQDHLCDCDKCMSSYVVEGHRSGPKPHNLWALSFLKQCKRNFHQSCAYWGFSHRTFAVAPNRSSGKIITKKKIKNPVRERFGINMPQSTREAIILDKANNKTL